MAKKLDPISVIMGCAEKEDNELNIEGELVRYHFFDSPNSVSLVMIKPNGNPGKREDYIFNNEISLSTDLFLYYRGQFKARGYSERSEIIYDRRIPMRLRFMKSKRGGLFREMEFLDSPKDEQKVNQSDKSLIDRLIALEAEVVRLKGK